MTKKKELKLFNVTFRAEVKRIGYIMAVDEADARKKFDRGDFDEGNEIDCYNIDDICIVQDEE